MEAHDNHGKAWVAWAVVAVALSVILAKGFFAFYMVTDRGQPTWDYRPVADIPGSSPYAVYAPLPFPQHVRGNQGG
jgi:hypothetical protein